MLYILNLLSSALNPLFNWFVDNVLFYEFNDEDRLRNAARKGDLEKIKSLVPEFSLNLSYKIYNKHNFLIDMLLTFGTDTNVSSMIKSLIKAGADYKTRDFSLLTTAIKSGDNDFLELLIVKGANIRGVGDDLDSIMHRAFASGRVDAIAHLAERGGDINSQCTFDEHTPVYSLVTNSDIPSDIKRQIIEKHLCRIDFDAPHSEGNPMLFYVEQNCPELKEMIGNFLLEQEREKVAVTETKLAQEGALPLTGVDEYDDIMDIMADYALWGLPLG